MHNRDLSPRSFRLARMQVFRTARTSSLLPSVSRRTNAILMFTNSREETCSKSDRWANTSHHKKRTRYVRLKTSILNLDAGTKVRSDLFEKLSSLHVQVSNWLRDGSLFDAQLGSCSSFHILSSELDFLQRLDVESGAENGTSGFDFLRRHRDIYVSLQRRGRQIHDTFRVVIGLRSCKGKVEPLLDALMQLVDVAAVHSSRAQRFNALLVRWCSDNDEKVRKALQEVRFLC